ncbi:aldose 1-epimerase family protein [Baekduia soli]|uniref:Aldose 1-epimerase family protein n=1 Tax=Baekduia soli TaxID=496014 RepID=A0A5B8U093_9ACTN|nr:aldose 1-epimerase family protein [Baekduia soli]QEC46403.1 aldose 1-epimerase family protein [Baekduia soli]
MTAIEIPSGSQFELRSGDQRAIVVEVGGALRSYVAAGHELLDGYGAQERCTSARGQSLIPWPNRLRDGRYSFAGRQHQLPLTEPAKHNAIHGLVRWANWSAASSAQDRVTMTHLLHPQSGWPFTLALEIEYSLSRDGLTVRTRATNVGSGPCPYGAGAHPYLTLGTETIDSLLLQAPGQRHLTCDERGIPTGSAAVAGTKFDFLRAREIGDARLDTAYGDLLRDPDGRARVRVITPDRTRRATLWLDAGYPYLMLFTGDSLPKPRRRRRGLGIEPMTCAPNALQSGDGLLTLEPGERVETAWGIAPE